MRFMEPEEQALRWPVFRWNFDKPHRCPRCHSVYTTGKVPKWSIMRCCRCDALVTRFPRLWRFLPYRGVVCTTHGPVSVTSQPHFPYLILVNEEDE